MLKALNNKLILYGHIIICSQFLVCIRPKCFIINSASVTVMLLHKPLYCVPCSLWLFLLLCSFSLRLRDSLPSTVPILPFCASTYPLLLLFLTLGWWQSGIWVVCLLFHDMLCCVTSAAWSLSFTPPPPSPPWKPTDFNVRVCLRSP